MLIINNKKIAGNYKTQLITNATTTQAGIVRLATDDEALQGDSKLVATTPHHLNTLGDNVTVSNNGETSKLTAVGMKTKDGTYLFDWVGTNAEYEAALADGTIPQDGNWVCWITDDTPDLDEISLSKANISLDNLTEEGEKHFLNKSQITNCLLEIPQRIKYTLEDGTLTIKAGSVVIVPYGTEDLTSQYPVGATFINENLKVVDTQFADGKFFVWVELVNDITDTGVWGTAESGAVFIDSSGVVTHRGLGRFTSGDTAPTETNARYWYDTSLNYSKAFSGGASTTGAGCSLPLMTISLPGDSTTSVTSVNQVFNGIGYIGSTIWVDKGVKGLIPNGRNEDGSLKNVEWTCDSFFVRNYATTATNNYYIIASGPNIQTVEKFATHISDTQPSINSNYYERWYNPLENKCYSHAKEATSWVRTQFTILGEAQRVDGNYTSFNPKQPIRLVDSDNIDGQVVYCGEITIFNTTTIGSYTIDLSSYVPIDGHGYDLYICCAFGPDNSSDKHDRQVIIYDGTNTSTTLARFTYDVANSQVEIPTIIPLSASAQSKITVRLYSNSAPFSRAIIYLHAIRRRGNSI